MRAIRRIVWVATLVSVGAGIAAGQGVGTPAAGTPADPNLWNARPPGAGDYKIVAELSGRAEVNRYIDLSLRGPTLQSLCDLKRDAPQLAADVAESALADLAAAPNAPGSAQRAISVRHTLAQLAAFRGDMAKTIEHLEAAYAVARSASSTPGAAAIALELEELLGVAWMRRGELENCVHDRNADRCIFPIRGAGAHTATSGAAAAVEYFTKYLAEKPDDLEVRWLLNVAYQTLGQYPDKVPKQFLIPPAAFESKESVGRFVDIAHGAGLDATTAAGGAIVDDFDGDGLLDVVFSSVDSCEPLRFYHNDGDGRFTDRAAAAKLSDQLGGINCCQTDYDNDGNLDVFVMRGGWEFPMRNSLLRNNGDGTFADVTVKAGLNSVARTHAAQWADFDGDGWVDLFVGHEESKSQLFRNNGDGTFTDVAKAAGVDRVSFVKGAAWGDYDNDGRPDLYVSNYGGENFLYHNDGDGTFTDVAKRLGVEKPVMSFPCWFFDYDNDGWLDLFVADYQPTVTETARWYLGLPPQAETLKLYRNDGKGGFEDVTAKVGLDHVVASMGANYADVDDDGFLDIYLGTGAPSYAALVPNVMFRNHDGKSFVDVTTSSGTGHLQKGHGIAFGDLDNDGDVDLFLNVGGFVPGDSYNKVLFANPGQGNNWLSVKLVGAKTNRAAIGAKIRATLPDGSIRYREVSSGGSYGASTFVQTIGLGKATKVAKLEVYWPGSKTWATYADVAANRFVEIREGAKEVAKRDLRPIALGAATPAGAAEHAHAESARNRAHS